MKKLFSFIMVAVLLATVFAFNVGTAEAASVPTYKYSHFVVGKGVVFVFDLNGANVRGPNLNATLYLNGNSYPLACKVNKEEGTIICTVRGGLTEFAGDAGSVSLLGRLYSVIIPARPELPEFRDNCPPALQRGMGIDCCDIFGINNECCGNCE